MSCSFSKLLSYEVVSLDVLRNKVVSIDIAPWLYKYLYNRGEVLKSSTGVVTSHLKGFLNLLKHLKQAEITVIVCLDGGKVPLKQMTVKKRTDQRRRRLDLLDGLLDNGFTLNHHEERQRLYNTYYIGKDERQIIERCCTYLGVTYYIQQGVEGEMACTYLKKAGIADQCMTLDRDAFLYHTSFFSQVDFKSRTIRYYDLKNNLDNLGLDQRQYIYASIASGCDYTSGLPRVGPKKAHKHMIEDPERFIEQIRKEVLYCDQIVFLIATNLNIDDESLKRFDPDVNLYVSFLDQLGFNKDYILRSVVDLIK